MKICLFGIVWLWQCCYYSSGAATPASKTCFRQETHRLADSIASALARRQYSEALSLVNLWLREYGCLPAEKAAEFKPWLINAYYIQTCIYADRNEVPSAVSSFDTAVRVGYKNYSQVTSDRHLDPLRHEHAFIELLEKVRERGDYLYVLQRSEGYSDLPRFSYGPSGPFTELRTKYRFDTIGSSNDELSRIISLLHLGASDGVT